MQKHKTQTDKTQTRAQKATHPAHLTLYLLATQPTRSHESPSCNQRPHSAYIPTSQVPNLLPISQDFHPRPRTPYNTARPPTHLRTYRSPTKKASSPREKLQHGRTKPLYTQYVWEADIRDSFPSNPLEAVLIRGPTVVTPIGSTAE